jgi:hypothetical protein
MFCFRVPLLREIREGVGLTGFEPVTLRLSSACSNQLSYRPFVGRLRKWQCCEFSDKRQALHQLSLPNIHFPVPYQVYKGVSVEARGFEPLTYSLQSYRSTN